MLLYIITLESKEMVGGVDKATVLIGREVVVAYPKLGWYN